MVLQFTALAAIKAAHAATASVAAIGVIIVVTLLVVCPQAPPPIEEIHVAFVGNSIMFGNDVPRTMEALSKNKIKQNSCLHGSIGFKHYTYRGNGMLQKWTRDNGVIRVDEEDGYTLYDYGACTMTQLLLGYDENLSFENDQGHYVDDGRNPCFSDETYYKYVAEEVFAEKPKWDYWVLNDKSTYPAIDEYRQESVEYLLDTYLDLLLQTGARPVFIQTYAFNVTNVDSDEYEKIASDAYRLGDVPEFTSHVAYGYQYYASALAQELPEEQQPLIAPVGLAFLTIYEENYGFWVNKLFNSRDYLHPSPHGTFLLACVLFGTLYGRMPSLPPPLLNHHPSSIFKRSRRMQYGDGAPMDLPTRGEAAYLLEIAERVVIHGHVPDSLLTAEQVVALEEAYAEEEEDAQ